MKWKASLDRSPKADLIPLLDTIFILLIFFIYSVSMMSYNQNIPVNLAEAKTGIESKFKSVSIALTNTGGYFLNKRAVSENQLNVALKTIGKSKQQQASVVLSIDKEVPFDKTVKLLDKLRSYNIMNISFKTQKAKQ